MRDARWRIGGLAVRVTSTDPDLVVTVPPAVLPFVDHSAHADAIVSARWGDVGTVPPGSGVFDSGGLWTLTREADELRFHLRSPKFGAVPYKVARFQPDFSRGEVILHRPYFDTTLPAYPLEYPLDELLFVNLLARRDGVEVHGCGVIDRAAGLLFIGQSGAGKSTIARLWQAQPGVTVLSDDRIIVRCQKGQLMMHGTPWHGDAPLSSPGAVKLTRVFVLRQGPGYEVRPIDRTAAVAQLFACCFPPFYSGEALSETLRILDLVAQRTSCAELWFRPDETTIRRIRSHEAI